MQTAQQADGAKAASTASPPEMKKKKKHDNENEKEKEKENEIDNERHVSKNVTQLSTLRQSVPTTVFLIIDNTVFH